MQICRNIRPSGHTYYQNLSHSLRPWSYKSSGCDPPSGLGGLKHFQGAEILRYRNIFIFSLDSGLRSFSVHSGGASLNILISLHIHSAQWAPHRVCPLYNCAINSIEPVYKLPSHYKLSPTTPRYVYLIVIKKVIETIVEYRRIVIIKNRVIASYDPLLCNWVPNWPRSWPTCWSWPICKGWLRHWC